MHFLTNLWCKLCKLCKLFRVELVLLICRSWVLRVILKNVFKFTSTPPKLFFLLFCYSKLQKLFCCDALGNLNNISTINFIYISACDSNTVSLSELQTLFGYEDIIRPLYRHTSVLYVLKTSEAGGSDSQNLQTQLSHSGDKHTKHYSVVKR